MNISDPLPRSRFAADCQDILISDTQESRRFTLLKGGTPILDETYNYDADGNIRIAGLAQVLSQSLYGELKEGHQSYARNTFDFQIDGETQFRKTVYAMRLQNPKDPDGQKNVLAMGTNGICYPGQPLLVTVIGEAVVSLSRRSGTVAVCTIGEEGVVTTVDCAPKKLFPDKYGRGTYIDIEDEIERIILPQPCDELVTVRFLNRYDMPESLTALYMTEKPSAGDDTSMMYGRRVRFSVKSTTEYTIVSGRLRTERQYDTWQDLLTSRKAQLLWRGEWVDIIITKSNYTRQRRKMYYQNIELSFQTANPQLAL